MKKLISVILIIFILTFLLNGCKSESTKSDKISVVTTVFPIYDLAREVIGDNENVELTLLSKLGTDLHSYQPSAEDIIKISSCDLFIYIGGASDKWVENALKNAVNKKMLSLNLIKELGDKAYEEEIVEGMQPETEETEEGTEYDEHIWLSLKNCELFTDLISKSLSKIDSDNSQGYKTNASNFAEKLSVLDKEYLEAFESSKKSPILFADRFPFRYLVDDYGIKYYAAFAGCSSESEASFETISFLANKVNEDSLKAVAVLEGSNKKIAETVINASGKKDVEILTLNSMQNVSESDIKNGKTYLSIAKANLETIKKLLG